MTPPPTFSTLVSSAAAALKERAEEVNRLNVFPVPDGDTGTNMSLTMDSVVTELALLSQDADVPTLCQAVTHASLMGARGNSGVILSQILRGLCDVIGSQDDDDDAPEVMAKALERAAVVAFQAVRKPVEGTMLTVLKDSAAAARSAADAGEDLDTVLDRTLEEALDSVRRTPELLPVLKENGVVDAGGFGLAILAEGLLASWRGTEFDSAVMESAAAPLLQVQPVDDWDDDEYLYCTEFLLHGQGLDRDSVESYLLTLGGSELVVGDSGLLKIHVHTDAPGKLLSHMTSIGEVADVHVNNMRRQAQARSEALLGEASSGNGDSLGFVAVGAGEGIREILMSLGVNLVVNGGQTMNPSTAEILAAVEQVEADAVIVLPNNKNIQMAAEQVIGLSERPVEVVPTTSVPEAFTAMLAVDPQGDVHEVAGAMTLAARGVRTGEVTTAVKDAVSRTGPVAEGQIIGVVDHEIEIVGDDVIEVAMEIAGLLASDGDTMTILGGCDLSDEDLDRLSRDVAEAHPDLEIEHHRGGQPLYPVIISIE